MWKGFRLSSMFQKSRLSSGIVGDEISVHLFSMWSTNICASRMAFLMSGSDMRWIVSSCFFPFRWTSSWRNRITVSCSSCVSGNSMSRTFLYNTATILSRCHTMLDKYDSTLFSIASIALKTSLKGIFCSLKVGVVSTNFRSRFRS